MIIPPSTPHTESSAGPQSPTRPPHSAATTPFSSPYRENIHLSPQKNPREGVALSNRILMGNKEACLTLQSIVPLDATDLRKQIEELISLIDRSRSFAPMSDADYSRKINLQSLIAELV
jgi:hypothetical protein